MRRLLSHLAACACLVAWTAQAAGPARVGVFSGALGGKSMFKALAKEKGLRATTFKRLTRETLLGYDAVIIGACTLDQPEHVKAIRTFLGCGGGLVLNHNSCGRRRPETLFPAVARKVVDRREDTVLVVKDRGHPIARGLPGRFEHAYYDHMYLDPGPEGTVVITDREGTAVVVAGQVGPGRVVFNGSLPGYWYNPATFAQGEKEPSGEELRLLVNAAEWAGAGRLTALPGAELAKRRAKTELELKAADLEKLLPTPDWFGREMLLGTYLPTRPVNELGGRFFITYDRMCWRGYRLKRVANQEDLDLFRNRMRIDISRLKWLGVTDIIYWVDVSGERVAHDTSLPDSQKQYSGVDPLAELVRLATPEGLNVWASWHACARTEAFAKKYCAKDASGKLYKYGGRKYCEDLLSPAYRERCHRLLDEYATKYLPLGNFKGLGCYDELWFCYADFHEDDLPALEKFCVERFGEKPPADVGQRLAKKRRWLDTSDVWRRRYILFKQHVMTEFWRDLVKYAHSRGLQIGVQLLGTAHYSSGWCWGVDSVELARLGADMYNTSCGERAANSYPNTLRWAHCYAPWGLYNTHCLRGASPGGIYFTFNQLWRLIMYANNPALPRELARHIHNQRQWAEAQSLARVAFLHNQNALQMLMPDPRPRVNRDTALFDALQRTQDADVIFTRAHERYAQYRVLVAMPYSVRGLSAEVYGKLKGFVEDGGTIVSVNADWTVSRADLAHERDVTPEMVGVLYGKAAAPAPATVRAAETEISLVLDTPRRAASARAGTGILAQFTDGSGPAVTEKRTGKGRVICVHFGAGAELEKHDNQALVAYFASLVRADSRPEITAEGTGFRVISTLRKGNWVAVSLFPDQVPAVARLHIDTRALGIEKTRFRMLMLGKRMEITRPGDLWGDSGFWSADELKNGFPVTIVADNDRVMPLPEGFDLSDFKGKKRKQQAGYLDNIARSWWNSESRGKRKRTYAHEIVVIAPADEPVMPAR